MERPEDVALDPGTCGGPLRGEAEAGLPGPGAGPGAGRSPGARGAASCLGTCLGARPVGVGRPGLGRLESWTQPVPGGFPAPTAGACFLGFPL